MKGYSMRRVRLAAAALIAAALSYSLTRACDCTVCCIEIYCMAVVWDFDGDDIIDSLECWHFSDPYAMPMYMWTGLGPCSGTARMDPMNKVTWTTGGDCTPNCWYFASTSINCEDTQDAECYNPPFLDPQQVPLYYCDTGG